MSNSVQSICDDHGEHTMFVAHIHERWNTGSNKSMHLEKANIYKVCLPASNVLLSKKRVDCIKC